MLKGSKKTDLFNLWLDHGGEWDSVACAVERAQETVNLSRKEWVAIQAKTLKERLPEARFTELIRKRMEAGLFYKDDDFPEDELDWCSEMYSFHILFQKALIPLLFLCIQPVPAPYPFRDLPLFRRTGYTCPVGECFAATTRPAKP